MEEKEKEKIVIDEEKKKEYYRSIYRNAGLTEEQIKELERIDEITGIL